jgi:hypothetical protein
MQQTNEYGQITDPGEAHLMAAVVEAAVRQQEMLKRLLPHLDEITQEPGETERDVLRRMFTSPELGQGTTDLIAGMFGDEHGRLSDGS